MSQHASLGLSRHLQYHEWPLLINLSKQVNEDDHIPMAGSNDTTARPKTSMFDICLHTIDFAKYLGAKIHFFAVNKVITS